MPSRGGFYGLSFMLRYECALHTLIYTLPFETKLQYLGLSLETAEFLAPLFFQHFVLRLLVRKVWIKGYDINFHIDNLGGRSEDSIKFMVWGHKSKHRRYSQWLYK